VQTQPGSAPNALTQPSSANPPTFGVVASIPSSAATSVTVGSGPTAVTLSGGVTGSASSGLTASKAGLGVGIGASAAIGAYTGASITPAPGVTISAQLDAGAVASAKATIGLNGIHVEAAVGADATASLGATYNDNLGSAGSVSVGGNVETGVLATAAGGANISASGVSYGGNAYAGQFTAVNGSTEYTGDGFSAGAGATVITPGSLGASSTASFLGNGNFGIQASVALDLGFGGVGLSFNIGIPTSTALSYVDTGVTAVVGAFTTLYDVSEVSKITDLGGDLKYAGSHALDGLESAASFLGNLGSSALSGLEKLF
jgi:hypothetical protein